ncbi:MAG: type VI secretion system lipoprotein TssJ [Granulosicoccus sp.]|nr:type VI secretion system lipoprotein TssJ [Granulosicoccus sp.]
MQGHGERNITDNQASSRMVVLLVMLTGAALLSGCGLLQKVGILSKPEPPEIPAPPLAQQPYDVNLRLSASADLNPDTQSRPSPIQVRLFLTDRQAEIDSKSFEEMFDYSGNFVDPRPLAMVTLRPGETREITLPANKSQTLLVIAAAYRDPYQSVWKATAVITPRDVVEASASIGAAAVTISPSL